MQTFEGCPGSQMLDFKGKDDSKPEEATEKIESQLRQWPIQLHLVAPTALIIRGRMCFLPLIVWLTLWVIFTANF